MDKTVIKHVNNNIAIITNENPKAWLNKICQKNHIPLPSYESKSLTLGKRLVFVTIARLTGPDGEQLTSFEARGKTKSISQHSAAANLIEKFSIYYPEARGIIKDPSKKVKSPNKTDMPKKPSPNTNNKAKPNKPSPAPHAILENTKKLNSLVKEHNFSMPQYETIVNKDGSVICNCLLDTPDGEKYASAEAKDISSAQNAVSLEILKILQEDERAKLIAQGLTDTSHSLNRRGFPKD